MGHSAFGWGGGQKRTKMMTTPPTNAVERKTYSVTSRIRAFQRDGCRLFDADGRSYLDLTPARRRGAGHAHTRLAARRCEQAKELLHTSNLFFHPLQGEVAARLSSLSGLPRAFFCNSGTEAVEASLKFARRYWYTQGHRARTEFVAFERSFHGRTMGSLSVTWDDHYRAPFAPLVPGVTFVPTDDIDASRRGTD